MFNWLFLDHLTLFFVSLHFIRHKNVIAYILEFLSNTWCICISLIQRFQFVFNCFLYAKEVDETNYISFHLTREQVVNIHSS